MRTFEIYKSEKLGDTYCALADRDETRLPPEGAPWVYVKQIDDTPGRIGFDAKKAAADIDAKGHHGYKAGVQFGPVR